MPVGDQRLDVVEGVLHLLVQAEPELAVARARACAGPAFSSGSTIPPLRVLAPHPRSWASSSATDRPRRGELGGGREPGVAAADHHHVRPHPGAPPWPPGAASRCPATALGLGSPRRAGVIGGDASDRPAPRTMDRSFQEPDAKDSVTIARVEQPIPLEAMDPVTAEGEAAPARR